MKKQIKAIFILLALSQLAAVNEMVDPTRPPDARISSQNDIGGPLTVTAIFTYPGYQMAIVSGQLVMIGDQIGEFSVTSITANTVELVRSGKDKLVLELTPDVKQQK